MKLRIGRDGEIYDVMIVFGGYHGNSNYKYT